MAVDWFNLRNQKWVIIMSGYIPMITNVSIKNFKGIKDCKINDMAKINLFSGRNGCGKSSIMEAIYFTGKEFVRQNLRQSILRRANRPSVSVRELFYEYNLNANIYIELKFDKLNITGMRIQFSPQNSRTNVSLRSGNWESQREEVVSNYSISRFDYGGGVSQPRISVSNPEELRRYFVNSIFIDPTIKKDVSLIEGSYLSKVKLSEESSSDLVNRMAEIYQTQPSWEFLSHPDFPPIDPSRFAILERKKRLFIDNFGDGLHYGLAIMASAKTVGKTALFIEEIESHQHPKAIKDLIPNLIEISRDNNLQLFVTTHNPYVLRHFHYYYHSPQERKKEFRCFHIIRDKDSGEVEAKIIENITDVSEDLFGLPFESKKST